MTLVFQGDTYKWARRERFVCLIKLSFLLRQSVVRHRRNQLPSSTEAAEYTTLIRPVKGRRSNFLALRKVVKKRPANRAF